MNKDIPNFSLQRLPVYLNYLRGLPEENNAYISSGAIAKALGFGEVLVRKDLAYTSCVGRPKVGYLREELIAALEEFLCCNAQKNAVIVGVGGLGRALLSYGGFVRYGINVAVGFDVDPEKIGTEIAGKPVLDAKDIKEGCAKFGATLAIIAVPAHCAQEMAQRLAEAGIKAILNFAPVQLSVDESIKVINIDVAANLAVLASRL
ncbi:MAG: redox-sensing transcriptional repressor Rex [Candidatus Coproplasma sp.]